MDNDYAAEQPGEDNLSDATEVPAAAVIASSMTQGNMESGNVGSLAATLPGYVAVHDLTESEEEPGVGKLNLDSLEAFGSKGRETADDGVSDEQREIRTSELNG